MIGNNLLILIFVSILIILVLVLIFCNFSFFNNISNFESLQTAKPVEVQQIENNEFLKAYENLKEKEEKQNANKTPPTWNDNNTLESMELKPCLGNLANSNRFTCYSAPLWWYPKDKYDPNKFRSVYYGDYYDPINNYLGNAQEMFWDFKSVTN